MAQVSQTTMLYDETMRVRGVLQRVYIERFGEKEALGRVRFQSTVCRATQDRQDAAIEVCSSGCDAVIVIGGFASSNTRHLYELAGQHAPAYLVEDADSVISADRLVSWDRESGEGAIAEGWLAGSRPVRIGVLAGASTPDVVTGQVLERLGQVL
jgi:4-hydroxy-3-methylbut-2-enyl diphosphate reductase IspH